jgi:hypothetical protein
VALGRTFGVEAIPLKEPLITLRASFQRRRQLQEGRVPLTDAIALQPAVVPVVALGVIETLGHSSSFRIGVNVPQGIQRPSVVFWRNGDTEDSTVEPAPTGWISVDPSRYAGSDARHHDTAGDGAVAAPNGETGPELRDREGGPLNSSPSRPQKQSHPI